jgi:hypothetical protein
MVLLLIRILHKWRVWLQVISAVYIVRGWHIHRVFLNASLEVSAVRWLHCRTLLEEIVHLLVMSLAEVVWEAILVSLLWCQCEVGHIMPCTGMVVLDLLEFAVKGIPLRHTCGVIALLWRNTCSHNLDGNVTPFHYSGFHLRPRVHHATKCCVLSSLG